jgi:hypothetical protein
VKMIVLSSKLRVGLNCCRNMSPRTIKDSSAKWALTISLQA